MPTVSRRVLEAIQEDILYLYAGCPGGSTTARAATVAAIAAALKGKRAVAKAKKLRLSKKEIRKREVSDLRTIVMTRAQGRCESCGGEMHSESWRGVLELDHFLGGSNRRFLESIETCWALCSWCHQRKTRLQPSAESWFERFIQHARIHGYLKAVSLAQARLQFIETKKKFNQGRKA